MYEDQTGQPYTIMDAVLDDMTWEIYEEFRAEDELEIIAEQEEAERQYNAYYAWADNVMERYDRMARRNELDIP